MLMVVIDKSCVGDLDFTGLLKFNPDKDPNFFKDSLESLMDKYVFIVS